jgi:hypothetical protein
MMTLKKIFYNPVTPLLLSLLTNGVRWCDRSTEDAYSPDAPAFDGSLCCAGLDFVFAFGMMIIFETMMNSIFLSETFQQNIIQ